MTSMTPYLNFDGNAEAAFLFYKSVFGGEFSAFQRMSETPEGDKLPADEQQRVMHVALPLAPGAILMASDILPSMGHRLNPGNNVYITLNTESEAETTRIYEALSADGQIEMPLQKTFWNAYYGIFKDQFGTQWMINYDLGQEVAS